VASDEFDGNSGTDQHDEREQWSPETPPGPGHRKSPTEWPKNLSRGDEEFWLVGDRVLYEYVQQEKLEGPVTAELLNRLAGYGLVIVAGWVQADKIVDRCKGHNVPGYRLRLARFKKLSKDEAFEIAGEVVAWALKAYVKKVLKGGWSPDRGSLKTAFITYCLFEFSNVYRRWDREETQRFEVVPLEEQYDGTDGASHQHFAVGLSEDPALIIGRRLEVIDALKRVVRDDRTRVCFILRETFGFTHRQIAVWLNETEAAIEGVFYRHKRRLHPRATSDEPSATSEKPAAMSDDPGAAEGDKEGEHEDV
jgi:hypothetical protein